MLKPYMILQKRLSTNTKANTAMNGTKNHLQKTTFLPMVTIKSYKKHFLKLNPMLIVCLLDYGKTD